MKLLSIIIQDKDSDRVLEALVNAGFGVTRLASTGGFLRRGNVTLLLGLERDRINQVLDLLKQHVTPAESPRHAVTMFVLDLMDYQKV